MRATPNAVAASRQSAADSGKRMRRSDETPLQLSQRGEEFANFALDIVGIGHRLLDLRAKELAVTMTEAMHGHFYGRFGHAQTACQFGVRSLGLLVRNKLVQGVEKLRFPGTTVFLLKPSHGTIQQLQGPASVKNLLGSQIAHRFKLVARLSGLLIKRNDDLSATTREACRYCEALNPVGQRKWFAASLWLFPKAKS